MTLGERILKHRKKAGISQEELAVRLNVTRQSISLWETDQTIPSLDSLIALAEIFDVSLDALCGRLKESDCDKSTEVTGETANCKQSESDIVDTCAQKSNYIAYSETQYTKKLVRQTVYIATRRRLISYVVAIAVLLMSVIASIFTDNASVILS